MENFTNWLDKAKSDLSGCYAENNFWTNFITRYKNAKTVIQQLKNNEWEFKYNSLSGHCLTTHRDGLKLWVGNGSWFCEIEIESSNSFGLFWRHYVWLFAAASKTAEADNKYKIKYKAPKKLFSA
jgi:hypothetical protein